MLEPQELLRRLTTRFASKPAPEMDAFEEETFRTRPEHGMSERFLCVGEGIAEFFDRARELSFWPYR